MSRKIRNSLHGRCNPTRRKHPGTTEADRETEYDHISPASLLLEKIMDEIVGYATRTGLDGYFLLRHYQFTQEEIEEYFDRFGSNDVQFKFTRNQ